MLWGPYSTILCAACYLPFPRDFVYLSPGMLFTFPQGCHLFTFPQRFPRDVIYLSPGWIPSRLSWFTSFPKCKVTLRLLVSWILTEFPCSKKEQTSIDEILINLQLAKQWFPSSLIRWLCIQTVKYLLPLLKLPDRQLLLGLTWHRHAYHWNQTWWCQNTLSHCTHTWGKKIIIINNKVSTYSTSNFH